MLALVRERDLQCLVELLASRRSARTGRTRGRACRSTPTRPAGRTRRDRLRSSSIAFSVIAARLGWLSGRKSSLQRVVGDPAPGVRAAISGANCVVMLTGANRPSTGLLLTLVTPVEAGRVGHVLEALRQRVVDDGAGAAVERLLVAGAAAAEVDVEPVVDLLLDDRAEPAHGLRLGRAQVAHVSWTLASATRDVRGRSRRRRVAELGGRDIADRLAARLHDLERRREARRSSQGRSGPCSSPARAARRRSSFRSPTLSPSAPSQGRSQGRSPVPARI